LWITRLASDGVGDYILDVATLAALERVAGDLLAAAVQFRRVVQEPARHFVC